MSPLSLLFTIASFALIADITVAQVVCTAGILAADKVVGYSGLPTHTMPTVDNYLASRYFGANKWDQCKFRINIGTESDSSGKIQRINRMAIKFGVHQTNPRRFERKIWVNRQGTVKVKGRALSPRVATDGCYQTDPFPTDWYFCLKTDPSGCWTIDFGVPSLGCDGSVTYCDTGMGGNSSGHDHVTMSISYYYFTPRGLYGMCGQ